MRLHARLIPAVAARFRALADPGRLAILAALQGGERSVSQLVAATGRSQPNVSQHVASLARAGLVDSRREGNRVFYRIADPCVAQICDAVCESLTTRAAHDAAVVGARPRRRRPKSMERNRG